MSESDYMDICEQLSRDLAAPREVLKDWQEFAADVRASDAAGQDWLDGLKARTARIVEPCS